MAWLQLSVAAARGRVEAVGERLEAHGAQAVTLTGAGEDPLLEPAPGEQPLWDRVTVLALLPPEADLKTLRTALEPLGAQVLDVEIVADDDWQSRWRAHAVRARFGDRLWLIPRDEPFEATPADGAGAPVVVRLDPGLAFGSGSHPTTRLCLAGLAALPLDGKRVVDFGCGSGVLAVAACLLGAEQAVAVDHDPQALLAARDNATYNHIDADRLPVMTPEALRAAPDTTQGFDVVVANILANPLVELAPVLTSCLRPDGRLMLSGLLAHQERMIRDAYPEVEFSDPVREAEWIRLDGKRRRTATPD